MIAEKGNKVYTIDESMKAQYQADGFDIKDGNGNVIAYGKGKTVPYDDHMKAVKEIERLQGLLAEKQMENETLVAEIENLKAVKQEPAKKAESKKAGE